MRKIQRSLKTCLAFLLVITMIFANVLTVTATSASEPAQVVSIREIFAESGGSVQWDSANRRIIATLEDDTFLFYPGSTRAYRNAERFNLSTEIVIVNSVAYIAMQDLLRLFEASVEEETPVYTLEHLELTIKSTEAAIPPLLEELSITGLTIALVDANNDFTWVQGFGYADTGTGRPVDGYSIFGVASISKPFTAIAVMQLVEEGLIDLDEPVVTYLPEFSQLPDHLVGTGDYRNITVRMLLSHASGILSDLMASGVFSTDGYYRGYMDNFLDTLAGLPMSAPESYMFAYANNAFTLLGILVATVATDYDSVFDGFVSYTQENILTPSGMNQSTFMLTDSHMPYLAMPYINAATPDSFAYFNFLPTGGLFASGYDMARFMHIILGGGNLPEGGRLLPARTIRQMLTPQEFDLASGLDFMIPNMQPGIGFIQTTHISGFTYVGHPGNLIHYHSDMVFDLDSGIGVFVSVNSISGMPVVRDLAVSVLTSAVFEATGNVEVPVSNDMVEPVELDAADLLALEGVYTNIGASEFIRVTAGDGNLYLTGILPTQMTLIPLSDGSFVCPETTLRFWFEDYDGEILVFLGEFKSLMIGIRLNPALITAPEGFERWIGTYYVQNPPGLGSVVYRADIGIDEDGFAYMRVSTLNNMTPIQALISIDGYSFVGGISFSYDDDGTWLRVNDALFLLAE